MEKAARRGMMMRPATRDCVDPGATLARAAPPPLLFHVNLWCQEEASNYEALQSGVVFCLQKERLDYFKNKVVPNTSKKNEKLHSISDNVSA